jgi:hypothetical protein
VVTRFQKIGTDLAKIDKHLDDLAGTIVSWQCYLIREGIELLDDPTHPVSAKLRHLIDHMNAEVFDKPLSSEMWDQLVLQAKPKGPTQ